MQATVAHMQQEHSTTVQALLDEHMGQMTQLQQDFAGARYVCLCACSSFLSVGKCMLDFLSLCACGIVQGDV